MNHPILGVLVIWFTFSIFATVLCFCFDLGEQGIVRSALQGFGMVTILGLVGVGIFFGLRLAGALSP
jgi:hypothetical protein